MMRDGHDRHSLRQNAFVLSNGRHNQVIVFRLCPTHFSESERDSPKFQFQGKSAELATVLTSFEDWPGKDWNSFLQKQVQSRPNDRLVSKAQTWLAQEKHMHNLFTYSRFKLRG